MNEQGLSRRELLATSARGVATLGAGAMLAGCSQQRPCPAAGTTKGHNFRLGLDTYSLHHTLTAKDPKNRRDLWWLLDLL